MSGKRLGRRLSQGFPRSSSLRIGRWAAECGCGAEERARPVGESLVRVQALPQLRLGNVDNDPGLASFPNHGRSRDPRFPDPLSDPRGRNVADLGELDLPNGDRRQDLLRFGRKL